MMTPTDLPRESDLHDAARTALAERLNGSADA
jgi:hypothetical protein